VRRPLLRADRREPTFRIEDTVIVESEWAGFIFL